MLSASPIHNLHELITLLESNGELSRISASVDPVLEIAAITDRVCKQPEGGKALLFEKPVGSNFKAATNLFGSERRVCLALGIGNLNFLTGQLGGLLDRIPHIDFEQLDTQIASLPEFSCFAPGNLTGPDPELLPMNPHNLNLFPFLQNWPEDGSASGFSRYISMAQVFTVDPEGGTPNCGLYRVQVRGPLEAAIQWKAGSGGARHALQYRQAGKKMPVAIALGGDPAMLFSAMFPLPGSLDEKTFAGFLRGKPLQTAQCMHVPIAVPTGAEVVIEGYIVPGESVTEGPFGNHTGFYSPAAEAPLMRVIAISHRTDAVIPATVTGAPPMEDCWMAKAWERLLLAFIQKLVPSVKNIHFPLEWIFHQSTIISLENPHPGMVSDISSKLWAFPWFAASRILIFVEARTNKAKLSDAAWRFINRTDYAKDVIYDKNKQRIAIDATGCRSMRKGVEMTGDVIRRVYLRWREYGLA